MNEEENKHFNNCDAPICMCNKNSDGDEIWYAGEKVCSFKPISVIQKRQINITNLVNIGRLKKEEYPYTLNYLKKRAV